MTNSSNQISAATYGQLGGCLNSDLRAVLRRNGSHHYFTYYHVGRGQAYWKQDVPAGVPPRRDNTRKAHAAGGRVCL
jgi:hypothetical protein